MPTHKILGDKVNVYRRDRSRFWQCSTFLAGRNHRVSTKEESLARAKEFAEDWYLELRGKFRNGEILREKFVETVQRAIQHSRETMDVSAKQNDVERMVASLTRREREVAEQMIDGGSNKVIARKLQLSHRTVERHRQNVLKKLSLRSVLELGRYLGALHQESHSS